MLIRAGSDISIQRALADRGAAHPHDCHSEPPFRCLRLQWLDESARPTAQLWLIKDLLPAGGAIVLVGDSNTGKTFFAVDMAAHIARGHAFRDRRVSKGTVLYVAAEGGVGIHNRLAAYVAANDWFAGAPFALISDTVLLPEPDLEPILAAIREAEETSGEPVVLVVLDTLARVMAGGDENSGQDMGALVAAMDRIRSETGAAVMLVHHIGKDPSKGARGHSSLRAAIDTEITVEGADGARSATVTKQRDGRVGEVMGFELRVVRVGTDEEGGEITSCIAAPCKPPFREPGRRGTGHVQKHVLDLMHEKWGQGQVMVSRQDLKKELADRWDCRPTSVTSAIASLVERLVLKEIDGGVALAGAEADEE